MHAALYNYAVDRGIDIRLGHRVTDYFEDGEQAGVVANGERLTADVVFAAEGVRSPGRKILLGFEGYLESCEYAVYRDWYPAERLRNNDITKHLVSNGDWMGGWIGPDLHLLCSYLKDGQEFSISYMSLSHVNCIRITDHVNFVAAHSATAYSNDVEWPAT